MMNTQYGKPKFDERGTAVNCEYNDGNRCRILKTWYKLTAGRYCAGCTFYKTAVTADKEEAAGND